MGKRKFAFGSLRHWLIYFGLQVNENDMILEENNLRLKYLRGKKQQHKVKDWSM